MTQPAPSVSLVLVHGGASSHRMYSEVEKLLKNEYGYTNIYAVDLPGHGTQAADSPFTFERSTQELLSLTRSIKKSSPDLPVSIIGVSLGGQAVLDFVRNHPNEVDAVIVSGTSIAPPDSEITWEMPRLPVDDPVWMQIIMEDAGKLSAENLQELQKLSLGFTFEPSTDQKTAAPILIVRGERDMAMAKRDFETLVEKAQRFSASNKTRGQVLAGAWHNHPIDVPVAFAELIDLWNKGVFLT